MRRFVNLRDCMWGLYVNGAQVWDDAPHYPIIEPHLTSALEGVFE